MFAMRTPKVARGQRSVFVANRSGAERESEGPLFGTTDDDRIKSVLTKEGF